MSIQIAFFIILSILVSFSIELKIAEWDCPLSLCSFKSTRNELIRRYVEGAYQFFNYKKERIGSMRRIRISIPYSFVRHGTLTAEVLVDNQFENSASDRRFLAQTLNSGSTEMENHDYNDDSEETDSAMQFEYEDYDYEEDMGIEDLDDEDYNDHDDYNEDEDDDENDGNYNPNPIPDPMGNLAGDISKI